MIRFKKHIFRYDGLGEEPNLPPTVLLTAVETPVIVGFPTMFDIAVSDPENNIIFWEMDHGNGFKYDGSGQPPSSASLSYDVGTYTAKLTVVDHKGITVIDTEDVETIPDPFFHSFDRDTGRYVASPGDLIKVRLSANGTDSGTSYINVTDRATPGGVLYGSAQVTWNPGSPEEFQFVMPAAGEVFFYGRHSLGDGGSKSNASQVLLDNTGRTINFTFTFDNPLP